MQREDEHRVERDIDHRAQHDRPHRRTRIALTHHDLVHTEADEREHRSRDVGRKIRACLRPERLAAPEREQDRPAKHEQRHGREQAERQQQIEAVRDDLPRAVHIAPPHADAHERAAAETDERAQRGDHRHDRGAYAYARQRVRAYLRDVTDIHSIHHAV